MIQVYAAEDDKPARDNRLQNLKNAYARAKHTSQSKSTEHDPCGHTGPQRHLLVQIPQVRGGGLITAKAVARL